MNKNVSIVTFRASLPAPTPAGVPVVIRLAPISPAMVELQLWSSAAPDMTASGFRAFTRNGQIIPDNGSNEDGITFADHEADWCPLPGVVPLRLALSDKILPGPAYDLELHFYSTAAIVVGGLLITRDPQHALHDLIVEMKSWQERLNARTDNSPAKHT